MALIYTYTNVETYGHACRVLRTTWDQEPLPLGPGFSAEMYRLAVIHLMYLLHCGYEIEPEKVGEKIWSIRHGL